MRARQLYEGDYVVVDRRCLPFYERAGIPVGTIGVIEGFENLTALIAYPDGQVLAVFLLLVERPPVLDGLAAI